MVQRQGMSKNDRRLHERHDAPVKECGMANGNGFNGVGCEATYWADDSARFSAGVTSASAGTGGF
jgi:hypothetical protein